MIGRPIPPIIKNLIIINILFYVATILFKYKGIDLTVILGSYYPGSPNFHGWQILTHMFMHSGYPNFSHIFFNMFILWMFGSTVEETLGQKHFLKLYIFSGFGGFFLYSLVNYIEINQLQQLVTAQGIPLSDVYNASKLSIQRTFMNEPSVAVMNSQEAIYLVKNYITVCVGASGAVFGIMLAFACLYPNQKMYFLFLPVGIKVKYYIPVLILIELFAGIRNVETDNVARFAHIGGALIGFLYIRHWKKNRYRRN